LVVKTIEFSVGTVVENSITDREVEGSNPASLHSASGEKGRTEIEIEKERERREGGRRERDCIQGQNVCTWEIEELHKSKIY
jgi:hypothetical protein